MSNDEMQAQLRTKALAQVKYADKALALWETLTAAYNQVPSDVRDAFIKVKMFFIEKEMNAYRNLFMLTSIVSEDIEAANMAMERFLAVDMAIMHLWSHNGEFPGSWLEKDEKKIRDYFKKVEREVRGKRSTIKEEKKKPVEKPVEKKPTPAKKAPAPAPKKQVQTKVKQKQKSNKTGRK